MCNIIRAATSVISALLSSLLCPLLASFFLCVLSFFRFAVNLQQSSLHPFDLLASSSSSFPSFFSVAITGSSRCSSSCSCCSSFSASSSCIDANYSRPTYRIAGKDVSVKYIRDVLFHLGEKQERLAVSHRRQMKTKSEKDEHQYLIGRKIGKSRRERHEKTDVYHESRGEEDDDSGRFTEERFRQQQDTPDRRIQTDSWMSGVCTPKEDQRHEASPSTFSFFSPFSLSSSSFPSSTSSSSSVVLPASSSSSSSLLLTPLLLSANAVVGDEVPRRFSFSRRKTEEASSLEKLKTVVYTVWMNAVTYVGLLFSYLSLFGTKDIFEFFFSSIFYFIRMHRVSQGRKRKEKEEDGKGKVMKKKKKDEREGDRGGTGGKEELALTRQNTGVQENKDIEGERGRTRPGGGREEEEELKESILMKFIDLVWRKTISMQVRSYNNTSCSSCLFCFFSSSSFSCI